jgi:signal peptide peptidase SppA
MNNLHHANIAGSIFDHRWAMRPESLHSYVEAMRRWSSSFAIDYEDAGKVLAARETAKLNKVEGDIAIINVFGVIAQRLNVLAEMFGIGVSTEQVGRLFDSAMASDDVGAVVLNIDSPGGTTSGVLELADKIFKARGTKPIVAIANSIAASAAYWIGSAAEQFAITPGGDAGSIGVFYMHFDMSKFNEQEGLAVEYIHAGKYKIEGNPDNPLDDEARAALQADVNAWYEMFVESVARHRKVTTRAVKSGFGEGRTVRAQEAVTEGMVDRVATLETVIRELRGQARPTRKRAEDQGNGRYAHARLHELKRRQERANVG